MVMLHMLPSKAKRVHPFVSELVILSNNTTGGPVQLLLYEQLRMLECRTNLPFLDSKNTSREEN